MSGQNPPHPDPETTFKWEEDLGEVLDNDMESRGLEIPPIQTLLLDADLIDSAQQKSDKTKETVNKGKGKASNQSPPAIPRQKDKTGIPPPASAQSLEDSAAADLEEAEKQDPDEETPTLPQQRFKTINRQKPKLSDSDVHLSSEPEINPYQESFTSQNETAELREIIESLGTRMTNLEKTVEFALKERSNLPSHLDALRVSINKQLTLMNDKLQISVESGVDPLKAKDASQNIADISHNTSEVLNTMTTELQTEPSGSSKIAGDKPISVKPRRVKLVK